MLPVATLLSPALLGLLALAFGPHAVAHDAWLRAAPVQPGGGLLAIHLAGGARYPKADDTAPAARIARSGCIDSEGRPRPLTARAERERALELRSRIAAANAASCWVELQPAQVSLTPELVEVYLSEIRAPGAVREAWARQRQAGGQWTETYRKFARAEIVPDSAGAADLSALRVAQGAGLELLPLGSQPLRLQAPSEFHVLADGQPVPHLAVEFIHSRSPLGIWRESDAQGRVVFTLPLAGEWLLRSTALEPPGPDGHWRSRFATLTVQVR